MSIEQSLERIAIALEKVVDGVGALTPIPEGKKKKEAIPAEDLGIGAEEKKITIDELRTALQGYKSVNGIDKTKALMIKHGANATKPVLTSIPEKNYAAIIQEIGV